MRKSIFEKTVDQVASKKQSQEKELQGEIQKALDAFISVTEIDRTDVFFYQNGGEVEIDDMVTTKGVMSFEWGILVQHETKDFEVRIDVNAVKKVYFNADAEVVLSLGEYDPDIPVIAKNVFMDKLIEELTYKVEQEASS
ncbi:hypothetical protein [Serratia grimesii]|uniref:hypothetical protein n=1 Tax=Serratia grimesii TaxID=82995 RepID=UPI0021793FB9|nr:hypothetical protein [Serratia grimesii]CAI0894186.1 Uncharacterised protein [Serratia grimesii]